jgi:hypothetical protein
MGGYQPSYDDRAAARAPSGGSAVSRSCEHTFEARHDRFVAGELSKEVYVRDVCTKCGATVER